MSADATVHCQSCCRLRQRNVSNCCVARPWDSIPKVLNGSPGLGCNWFQVPTQIFVFYNPVDFFLDLSYFSRDGGDGFPHLLFLKRITRQVADSSRCRSLVSWAPAVKILRSATSASSLPRHRAVRCISGVVVEKCWWIWRR